MDKAVVLDPIYDGLPSVQVGRRLGISTAVVKRIRSKRREELLHLEWLAARRFRESLDREREEEERYSAGPAYMGGMEFEQ